MMLQTKAADSIGQVCSWHVAIAFAWFALTACGGQERVADATELPAAIRSGFSTQLLNADPCGWLSADRVGAVLRRTLRGVPVRVASAETLTPSATGGACMYELEPVRGVVSGVLSIEVKVDGAEMEAGLAASTAGALADAEGSWSAAWDWVGGLPAGLFAARQGHVGVLIAINDPSLAPRDVEPLAGLLLSKLPDLPFAAAATDPAVAGRGRDPCALIERSEAESVLGALSFAPYRSHASSPVAHGDGPSCTYYTPGHHVVVLTPTWSKGKTVFGQMRGVAGLTRQGSGERATTRTGGAWDDRSTGVAGTQYFLKGDRMLELQHRASHADDAAATQLARIALGRM